MLDAGTWPGGYVKYDDGSVGYIPKGQAMVYGYSGSGAGSEVCGSDDYFSTGSDDWSGSDTDEKGSDDDGKGTGKEGSSSPVEKANTYLQGIYTFNGRANNFTFSEAVGINGGFSYKGSYLISGLKMEIYAEITTPIYNGCKCSAAVEVYRNGMSCSFVPLKYDLSVDHIVESGHYVLGNAILNLPKEGNVRVELIISLLVESESGKATSTERKNIIIIK